MDALDPPDVQMDEPDPHPANSALSATEHGADANAAAKEQKVDDGLQVDMAYTSPPATTGTDMILYKPVDTMVTEYSESDNEARDVDTGAYAQDAIGVDGHGPEQRTTSQQKGLPLGRQSRMSVFEEDPTFDESDFHDAMQSVTMSGRESRMSGVMQDLADEPIPAPGSYKRDDPALDLVHSVEGMYRLLDLVSEEGSTGLVEKVIMDAEGMRRFMERLSPGAYTSMTRVNFRALDTAILHPVGVYGSKEMIVQFLVAGSKISAETAQLLLQEQSSNAIDRPTLRSGLYIVDSNTDGTEGHVVYVLYWPEDSTWDDEAGPASKRNRVTFMRYLTKLCDQLLAFISPTHSATLVWGDDSEAEDDEDMDDAAEHSRVFSFQVKKTSEQEDNVEVYPGFTIRDKSLQSAPFPADVPGDHAPCLVKGETQQAVMTARFVQGRIERKPLSTSYYSTRLSSEISGVNSLKLGKSISNDGIRILVGHGLDVVAPDVCADWKSQMKEIDEWQRSETRVRDQKVTPQTERDRLLLFRAFALEGASIIRSKYKNDTVSAVVTDLLGQRLLRASTSSSRADDPSRSTSHGGPAAHQHDNVDHDVGDSQPDREDPPGISAEHDEAAITAEWQRLSADYPGIAKTMDDFRATQWDRLVKQDSEYTNLKSRFIAGLEYASMAEALDEEDAATLASHIISGKGAKLDTKYTRPKGVFSTVKGLLGIGSEVTLDPKTLPDSEFIQFVWENANGKDWLEPVVTRIIQKCAETWTRIVGLRAKQLSHSAAFHIEGKRKDEEKSDVDRIVASRSEDARLGFLAGIAPLLQNKPGPCLTLDRVERRKYGGHHPQQFDIVGQFDIPHEPSVEYAMHFVSLTAQDQSAIRSDTTYTPAPRMPPSNTVVFRLPIVARVKHVQLFDADKILLISEDPYELSIFVEKRTSLRNAVTNNQSKKTLRREKLDPNAHIAYDEGSRLLVILSAHADRCAIHVFGIDEKDGSVRARGSPVDIIRWFDGAASVAHLCFVTGSSQEELCIVEQSGRTRIFSLVTETCRPAALQLPPHPSQVLSAPDGSCLIVVHADGTAAAHHWDGFGSSDGFVLPLPEMPSPQKVALTSLVTRSCVHLLALDAADSAMVSFRLRIQKKSSEFHLRKDHQPSATHATVATAHNCLLECLSEVWTRFPVIPAIGQDTLSIGHAQARITYVCDDHHDRFQSHFSAMVRRFERTTRKPTQHVLDKILIEVVAFDALMTTGLTWPMSSVRAGDWIIKSICLLPLQIAVARDNRFLPLKDGVWSSQLEQDMLGSSVNQVADSITFGWYESIFTYYDKPVKVVSSMGEQSTGKSYMLSHLVDTSFAGSAMRCTEGVWMCVTPTASTLFVALDFEGVHSLERSVQEDALLVLFNAAISNLILFRNNFAMSRNIAGMFTSFQSSSSLFDPASNPTLFRSCLVIVIKDVVDADTKGIVQEFEDKFQRIVMDEQEANFLTRLHRGQLRIIPWPVIESRKYYTAYNRLKQELINQPISHPRAGVFLHTMKTLMAKIKACDWGALDQNLAAHRADQLRSSLRNALILGLDDTNEALKDLDTSTVIPHADSDAAFYLCGPIFDVPDDPARREAALATLCSSTDLKPTRQDRPDEDWMSDLSRRLDNLVDARIAHVKDWIAVNAARFEGHADIQKIGRILDAGVLELRDGISICRSKCEECYLLCARSKRHQGAHDCQDGHVCKHKCSFIEEHAEDQVDCELPAGHAGKHMCEVVRHLCGHRCALSSKPGCLGGCMKHADHADDGHFCSARTHGCGQLCALATSGLCRERCAIPHDEPHETHSCRAMGCPHPCELCKRLCSSSDHFHALYENVTHLCGQEHPCNEACTSDGWCEVSTDPIAVETTFTGRHDTFQFTKYTQNVKKLVCAVPIPSGETQHRGPHVHDVQSVKPFHYCTARCPSCGYVCNLPYGHTQREHETAHGSMSHTEWALEGDADASVELSGHTFGQRDSGAPMLCSVYCSGLGRHAHIDYCKTPEGAFCGGQEYEHISGRMNPSPRKAKDYITHALFWRRSGFKDPYSREEQNAFALCDAMCAAPEHQGSDLNAAQPSYCTLPLFHGPQALVPAPAIGYISNDGHNFSCANPAVSNQAYHIIFVGDRSGSMGGRDHVPLAGTPVTAAIARSANNRLGSVFSALYSLWAARHGAGAALRRDAYSVVLFDHAAATYIANDLVSTPEELLNQLLVARISGGTNFDGALLHAQTVMEAHWSVDRAPVVIFLSDGECGVTDTTVTDLCRRAVVLGKPLAFHAVSFGRAHRDGTLNRMATLARDVYRNAPGGGANANTQCTSTSALDTVRLAETFIGIADSLKKPRAALVRSGQ